MMLQGGAKSSHSLHHKTRSTMQEGAGVVLGYQGITQVELVIVLILLTHKEEYHDPVSNKERHVMASLCTFTFF